MPEVASLAALSELVAERPGLFIRSSKGPDHDADERSTDYATALTLTGFGRQSAYAAFMVDASSRQVGHCRMGSGVPGTGPVRLKETP
jgi:hypothetical protein